MISLNFLLLTILHDTEIIATKIIVLNMYSFWLFFPTISDVYQWNIIIDKKIFVTQIMDIIGESTSLLRIPGYAINIKLTGTPIFPLIKIINFIEIISPKYINNQSSVHFLIILNYFLVHKFPLTKFEL